MAGVTSTQATVELDADRKAALQALANRLPPSTTPETPEQRLERLLTGLASAALEEYVEYLSSERHPGTLAQHRELRLSLLMAQLFGDSLPSERLIADMLGLTPGEARSLVPRVLARYRKRLSGTLEESAKSVLKQARSSGDDSDIICDLVTYRFLKERLAGIAEQVRAKGAGEDGLFVPIAPDRRTVNGYTLNKKTFDALWESLGLPDRNAGQKK